MKKLYVTSILFFFVISGIAQITKGFKETFKTSSGIYGYVEGVTKPATYGFANIQIQQRRVVVEGISNSNGNFSGSDLSDFGVNFPLECSNCYFYASGMVTMSIDYGGSSARFGTSGAIHKNDYTIHDATFSERAISLHNQRLKDDGYSEWLKSGYVTHIDVSGVAGGDLGRITSAVQQLKRQEREEKEQEEREEREREEQEKQRELEQELESNEEDPDIVIQENESEASSTDSGSSSSSGGSSSSYNSNRDRERTESEKTYAQAKAKQDANTMNDASRAEARGDFHTSATIKNNNPNLYSYEERQDANYRSMAQSTIELAAAVGDLVKSRENDPREIARKKRLTKERDAELLKVVNSSNLDGARIEKKKKYYGVIDANGSWLIEPKYIRITLKKEYPDKIEYRVLDKKLRKKTITLNK